MASSTIFLIYPYIYMAVSTISMIYLYIYMLIYPLTCVYPNKWHHLPYPWFIQIHGCIYHIHDISKYKALPIKSLMYRNIWLYVPYSWYTQKYGYIYIYIPDLSIYMAVSTTSWFIHINGCIYHISDISKNMAVSTISLLYPNIWLFLISLIYPCTCIYLPYLWYIQIYGWF